MVKLSAADSSLYGRVGVDSGKRVIRGRSKTEPNLALRVGSSDESIPTTTTSASHSKSIQQSTRQHEQRNPRLPRPYTDMKWANIASSSDTKSMSQADQDLDIDLPRTTYSNINETAINTLTKSPSSTQLHFIRNSGGASRPHRYGRGGGGGSGVAGHSQSYSAVPPPYSTKPSCCGCCEHAKKPTKAESVLSLAEDPETPEGLSWRRLHMSRAKLKATATTSELLSGFAMVAMVELQINKPTSVPEWLFVTFAVCTTVLVSVHIFALMISTYLLPSIDAVSKLHVSSLVTESPHDRMKTFIELAWAFSTILGLLLFLVEIAILCWVKFWDYSFTAAMSATMIVIPVLVVFVAFAMHFYHSLVVIKCKTSVTNIQELENIKKQLDSFA